MCVSYSTTDDIRRPSSVVDSSSQPVTPCRSKVQDVVPTKCSVATLGSGDVGQLGLGPDVQTAERASRVSVRDVVQVAAGGMHTVCLDSEGRVHAQLF